MATGTHAGRFQRQITAHSPASVLGLKSEPRSGRRSCLRTSNATDGRFDAGRARARYATTGGGAKVRATDAVSERRARLHLVVENREMTSSSNHPVLTFGTISLRQFMATTGQASS